MKGNKWDSGAGWAAAFVFAVALLQRVIATGFFLERWGPMATSGPEYWFYYGVAKGNLPPLSLLDPTEWLLRLLGLCLRGEALFYAILCLSAFLSALGALALFYLVLEIHGRKVALVAALLYASMVQPVFDASATFIHELVLYPLFPLSVLFAFRAMQERRRRIRRACLSALLLFLSFQVGPSASFALLSILFAFLVSRMEHILREGGWSDERIRILSAVFLLTACVLLYRYALRPFLNVLYQTAFYARGIDVSAQLKAGARDLQPVTLQSVWLRFNALIFFLPFGAYAAYRRRDFLSLSLAAFPLVTALYVDRATRPAAFGVAILAALAFTRWQKRWSLPFWGIVPFLFLSFVSSFSILYGFLFLTAAAFFWILLHFLRREGAPSPIALGLVVGIAVVSGALLPILNMEPKTTRGEYLSYKKLSEEWISGKILVPWSDGYFAQAVSGLPAALSPQVIRSGLGKIYWMPESDAAVALRDEGIGVIQVSDRDFSIVSSDPSTGRFSYFLTPAIPRPELSGVTIMPILRQTILFKLLYGNDDLIRFRLIGGTRDEATGFTFRIYEVLAEK